MSSAVRATPGGCRGCSLRYASFPDIHDEPNPDDSARDNFSQEGFKPKLQCSDNKNREFFGRPAISANTRLTLILILMGDAAGALI
jgi:hypothetical protein